MSSSPRSPFRPRAPGAARADHIERSFGGRPVLRDVSFELEPGTVAAVVGPNGSGKTTLLRILAGLVTPTRGTVSVSGSPPGRGAALYAPAGDRGLHWRLTGRQNLAFFGRIAGLAGDRLDEWIGWLAAGLDAEHLLEKRVGECSTGERRRLAVARAFVAGPPVVLLDEPFGDLDEEGRGAVDRLVRGWCEGGGLVLSAGPRRADVPDPDILLALGDGSLTEVAV